MSSTTEAYQAALAHALAGATAQVIARTPERISEDIAGETVAGRTYAPLCEASPLHRVSRQDRLQITGGVR